jgi:hypothetical protein
MTGVRAMTRIAAAARLRLPAVWLTLDVRAIGLFRILLASLTLFDCVHRFGVREQYYTELGVLPVDYLAQYRGQGWVSLLSSIRSSELVTACFLVEMVALLLTLVGLGVPVAKWIVYGCQLSIVARNPIVLNGADYILCAWWMWALFLPLDARYSLSSRLRHGRSYCGLVVTPVALVLVFQLAWIYALNAWQKDGWTWRDGSAVWYFLWQQRQVTDLGLWLRDSAPRWLFRGASYCALAIEGTAPVLLLSPWGTRYTRPLLLLLVVPLHVGIMLVLDLALFSPTMMVTFVLLLRPEHLDVLERWVGACGKWLTCRLPMLRTVTPPRQQRGRAPFPLHASWGKWLIACAIACVLTYDLFLENRKLRAALTLPPLPQGLAELQQALKLQQRWDMFSPNVPLLDSRLVVEFETEPGKYVDLETAGRLPPGPNQPRIHHQDTYWERYANALTYPDYRHTRPAFRRWAIERAPELVGLSPKQVLSVSAYWLFTAAPAIGVRKNPNRPCYADLFFHPAARTRELRQRRAQVVSLGETCSWLH